MTASRPSTAPVAVGDLDPDAVAAAVSAVPGVAALGGGIAGEVATYLPGRRVAGVRLTDDAVEVHVVLRTGATVPDVDRGVRAALAPVAPGAEVRLYVDDIEDP